MVSETQRAIRTRRNEVIRNLSLDGSKVTSRTSKKGPFTSEFEIMDKQQENRGIPKLWIVESTDLENMYQMFCSKTLTNKTWIKHRREIEESWSHKSLEVEENFGRRRRRRRKYKKSLSHYRWNLNSLPPQSTNFCERNLNVLLPSKTG